MDCKNISGCGFYHDKFEVMPSNAEELKSDFCKGEFASCARFKVSETCGKENVSKTLFPDMLEKANLIIQDYSEKK